MLVRRLAAEMSRLLGCGWPVLLFAVVVTADHACDSEVYCYGPLLETVQRADLYNDSKTFVDRPLRVDPTEVLNAFNVTLTDNSTKDEVRAFVDEYFLEAGSELVQWTPSDWTESPQFVQGINDPNLRAWALELNKIWKDLGRSIHPNVTENPQRYSLIDVPNPFIIPGGRFFEFYYWDTYWIVNGILLSEMNETARGMIENLANMVERYGLVPNGGRLYYLLRSQPPLLTQMVDLYYTFTQNHTFLEEMLPLLDMEYQFWRANRTLKEGPYANLTVFWSNLTDPRPEAYREDINTSRNASVMSEEVYTNLASAAESGMDFSSRWLQDGRLLSSIRTMDILPVDLNAILCSNEAILAKLYSIVGSMNKSEEYQSAFESRQARFNAVFWNESLGYWSDVLISAEQHNPNFYLSHLAPLAWNCVERNTTQELAVLRAMETLGLFDYVGGIPTSCNPSGQQWDFPDSWAPHQWYVVAGWYNSSNAILRNAALSVARKWVNTTYTVWEALNQSMFEKYNVETGYPGSGGEYVVQTGFGWTNGVVLHFLQLYGSVLSTSSGPAPVEESQPLWVIGLVLALLTILLAVCSLLCGVWCRWIYIAGRTGYWRRVRNEHAIAARGYHENDDFDFPEEDNSVTLQNTRVLSDSTQGILSTIHEMKPST